MSRSSDPEDGIIQHVPGQPAPSVEEKLEIPTKEKWGEAQRIVNKVHKDMSFAVIAACLISVLMDPFFFYIGLVDNNNKCFRTETRLQNLALISRSIADILFLMDMIFHINKARKQAGGGGVKAIANKLSFDSKVFITVDFFAILPIPQLLVVSLFTRARRFGFSGNRTSLNVLLLLQYLPRTYVLLRLSNNLRNNNSPVWFISVFYFATCILASHVIGAFWYFTAIQRQLLCWYQASCSRGECRNIYCDGGHRGYSIGTLTMINKNCALDDGAPFSFGMFREALKSGYMERTISGGKLSYFMWWGLKNLSTNGTDLQTSTYLWENCFAILLAILGMVLFAYLIGHMQQLHHLDRFKFTKLMCPDFTNPLWSNHPRRAALEFPAAAVDSRSGRAVLSLSDPSSTHRCAYPLPLNSTTPASHPNLQTTSSSTPAPSSRSRPRHTVIDQSPSSRPALGSSRALLLSLSLSTLLLFDGDVGLRWWCGLNPFLHAFVRTSLVCFLIVLLLMGEVFFSMVDVGNHTFI